VVIGDVAGYEEAAQELKAAGYSALGVRCDVTSEADATALMQTAKESFGNLDIAVLNAGILRDGLLIKVDKTTGKVARKMSLEQWQSVINVNLTGVFLTGREAAAVMAESGKGGVMILMSSIARTGNFGQTNYSAAKAGVASMAIVWAKELSRYNIRVAAIAPGFIETPMVMKDMKPEALEMFKKQIPIHRLGKPEEIAQTARYIVECDLVDATVVEASGGMRL
jgi:3-oxoacyl-[acyl-carrier protein] reductase